MSLVSFSSLAASGIPIHACKQFEERKKEWKLVYIHNLSMAKNLTPLEGSEKYFSQIIGNPTKDLLLCLVQRDDVEVVFGNPDIIGILRTEMDAGEKLLCLKKLVWQPPQCLLQEDIEEELRDNQLIAEENISSMSELILHNSFQWYLFVASQYTLYTKPQEADLKRKGEELISKLYNEDSSDDSLTLIIDWADENLDEWTRNKYQFYLTLLQYIALIEENEQAQEMLQQALRNEELHYHRNRYDVEEWLRWLKDEDE